MALKDFVLMVRVDKGFLLWSELTVMERRYARKQVKSKVIIYIETLYTDVRNQY